MKVKKCSIGKLFQIISETQYDVLEAFGYRSNKHLLAIIFFAKYVGLEQNYDALMIINNNFNLMIQFIFCFFLHHPTD